MKYTFHPLNNSLLSLLIAGTTLLSSQSARSASDTWNGTTDATWSTTTNWAGGNAPGVSGSATDVATFIDAGNGNTTITVGAVTLGSIIFDNTSTTLAAYTLQSGTFTLNNGGAITVNSNVVTNETFNTNFNLGIGTVTTNFTFTNNSLSSVLTFNGNMNQGNNNTHTLFVTGSGNTVINGNITASSGKVLVLDKQGTGTLTISGTNNTYASGSTLEAGILSFTNDTALGTGDVKFGNGTLSAANGTRTIANAFAFNTSNNTGAVSGTNSIVVNGVFRGGGAGSQVNNTFSNNLTGEATLTFSGTAFALGVATGKTVTFSGSGTTIINAPVVDTTGTTAATASYIQSSGNVSFNNASNPYAGATTINGGKLMVNGAKTGSGNVAVNANGTLAGTGTVSGLITTASNGHIAPGNSTQVSGIGTLTVGSLTLNTGSILDFEFSGSGNDQISVSNGGTLTLASGVKLNLYNDQALSVFSTNGTYVLFNTGTGSTVAGAASNLTIQNPVGGKTYNFATSSSNITLTIGTPVTTNYWATDTDSTWALAGNWTAGVPNTSGTEISFGPAVSGSGAAFTGPHTVTLDAMQTVGKITFDNANSFTVSSGTGGSLVLDTSSFASSIIVTTGTHVISAPIAVAPTGASFTTGSATQLTLSNAVSGTSSALAKLGAGTLTLTGSNSYGGGTTLNAGILQVNSPDSLGAVSGNLVFGGGTLQLLGSATSSRTYQVLAANNANIDTNGNNLTLNTGISRLGAATGGLVKSGTGTLTLTASSSYTGATTVNLGTVVVDVGGAIGTSGAAITLNGGSTLSGSGGTVTASSMNVGGHAIAGNLKVSAGILNVTGNINSSDSDATNMLFTGGATTAGGLVLQRTGTQPVTTGSTGIPVSAVSTGIYVNGSSAVVNFGGMTIGNNNSSASFRVDSGTVTVAGTTLIGANTATNRWNYLNINGGSFTSTGTATGIQIGKNVVTGTTTYANLASLYMTGGVTTAEIITFGAATDTLANQSYLTLNGGSLYVGSGGIVQATAISGHNIFLKTGTMGAKADWSSALDMTLSGNATIQAADVSGSAHNITLSGNLGGAGSLTKSGSGTLTLGGSNSYSGATNVNNGTLAFDVSETLTAGLNVATSGTAVLTPHGGGGVKVLDITGLTIAGVTPFAGGGNAEKSVGGLAAPTPVPEPGTLGLVALGAIGGAMLRLRGRKNETIK